MSLEKLKKLSLYSLLFLAVFATLACQEDEETEEETPAAVADACNHMLNGPDSTRQSQEEMHGELPHKRWRLTLAQSGSGYKGTFPMELEEEEGEHAHKKSGEDEEHEEGEVGIFLSKDVSITILEGTDTVTAHDETLNISCSDEIVAYAIYELEHETEYELIVSSSSESQVDVVFANLGEEHDHDDEEHDH